MLEWSRVYSLCVIQVQKCHLSHHTLKLEMRLLSYIDPSHQEMIDMLYNGRSDNLIRSWWGIDLTTSLRWGGGGGEEKLFGKCNAEAGV